MEIKGFVSDMDGVVADTEEAWYKGTREFLKEYGARISRKDYSKFIGTSSYEDIKFFKEELKIPLAEKEILIRRRRHVLDAMNKRIKLNDGYLELLGLLLKNRIKISLASSSPRSIIDIVVKKTGIEKYFISIVSVDDKRVGCKAKAYIQAVKSMHLEPSECFALEDSRPGGKAAKEAGLYCVAIPNRFLTGEDFSFADEVHGDISGFLRNGKILKDMAA